MHRSQKKNKKNVNEPNQDHNRHISWKGKRKKSVEKLTKW